MAKKDEKKRWGLYFIAALLFLVPLGILATASCTMSNGDLPDNGNTTFYDPGIDAPLETDVPLLCVSFIVLASILILVGYFIVRK